MKDASLITTSAATGLCYIPQASVHFLLFQHDCRTPQRCMQALCFAVVLGFACMSATAWMDTNCNDRECTVCGVLCPQQLPELMD